jgi:hypothetical protein
MEARSQYITNSEGLIKTRKLSEKFFAFQSITVFIANSRVVYAIRTTRKMAKGLMDYFYNNDDFKKQLLLQNQRSAIKFFYSADKTKAKAKTKTW